MIKIHYNRNNPLRNIVHTIAANLLDYRTNISMLVLRIVSHLLQYLRRFVH